MPPHRLRWQIYAHGRLLGLEPARKIRRTLKTSGDSRPPRWSRRWTARLRLWHRFVLVVHATCEVVQRLSSGTWLRTNRMAQTGVACTKLFGKETVHLTLPKINIEWGLSKCSVSLRVLRANTEKLGTARNRDVCRVLRAHCRPSSSRSEN